ncbi:GNVR domain-containing protein [Salinibacter grassmerensis]|uniref:GNVR domain-containing protein n=1 Tax=Salinibacter grassmerensis TaxID=3040353 RepID=UPI0021E925AB|nr:GNVR domain-containing protein [Salinibacter grassmerensis]
MTLVRERGLFVLVAGAVVLGGLTYAVASPSQYTAESTVVREAVDKDQTLPGSLPSLPGLDLSTGDAGGSGPPPSSYPDLLTSREVRLAVARDTFFFPTTGRHSTVVAHVDRPASLGQRLLNYTVWLPWTLKERAMQGLGSETVSPIGTPGDENGLIVPTEAEQEALDMLAEAVTAEAQGGGSLGETRRLMTISTTAPGPGLAARLNESFVEHLRRRVRAIHAQNTQQDLRFVRTRLADARRELKQAEDSLSQFLEQNRSVLADGDVPALSFRRDRLRRQVRFKEQLYSQLQGRLTETRLRLQRRQPVVTVAEQAAPPPTPSAPNRLLIVFISIGIGLVAGAGAVYFRSLRTSVEEDEDGQEKLARIRQGLTVAGLAQGVRDEIGKRRN